MLSWATIRQFVRPSIGNRRSEALSVVADSLQMFENAVLRAAFLPSSDTSASSGVASARDAFRAIDVELRECSDWNQIEILEKRALALSRLRALVYEQTDIELEFETAIANMKGWGVPEEEIQRIRMVAKDCSLASNARCDHARRALYAVYDEYDSWSKYIDFVVPFHRWVACILGALALLALFFGIRRLVEGDVIYGFILSGFTGACLSVISRLPPIATYEKMSAEILSIVSRLGAGMAATIVGGGFLAMNIVSVNLPAEAGVPGSRTLTGIVEICGKGTLPTGTIPMKSEASSGDHCRAGHVFLLIGIALLLGFSERALPSFEGKLIPGSSHMPTKAGT